MEEHPAVEQSNRQTVNGPVGGWNVVDLFAFETADELNVTDVHEAPDKLHDLIGFGEEFHCVDVVQSNGRIFCVDRHCFLI